MTSLAEFRELGLTAEKFRAVNRQQTEWAGPCPMCGGDDRFHIFTDRQWPSWNWWCRSCQKSGWADQLNQRLKAEVTPEMRSKWVRETEIKQAEADAKRRVALAQFTSAEIWRELHERMTEENRAWWDRQGIPSYLQDFYQLGFTPQKSFEHDGQFFKRDAYTIPKFGLNYAPKNLDYRIVDPPEGVGKYRPAAGLPAAYFLSRPDYTEMPGELFIVEGSKKAIIFCHYLEQARQVIGVPSCNSWAGAEVEAAKAERVWIMLDPDAQKWAQALAAKIGKAARVVVLPEKPDDMILAGAKERTFQRLFRYARRP